MFYTFNIFFIFYSLNISYLVISINRIQVQILRSPSLKVLILSHIAFLSLLTPCINSTTICPVHLFYLITAVIKSLCTFLQFTAVLIIIFLSALASTSILPADRWRRALKMTVARSLAQNYML